MPGSDPSSEFLDPPQCEDEIGRLGPYRVTQEIGKGGMGRVYRAEDTRLKRTVALKVMNKKFASTPNSRKRFVKEARSMAAVHHDNVATIFEVSQKDGTPYMAMELLRGDTLEHWITSGRKFDFQEIISIARQCALGLEAAHERGIVHRDIKPANLWMQSPQERIKILDFGLALAGSGVDQLVGVGSVVGTPTYLAPEQARNEPVDERTDLYALGVVLYELCTGKLPLLATNVPSQLILIISHEPISVAQRGSDVPKPLADLIHCLLSKEPGERIPTASQLGEDLLRVSKEIEHAAQQQLQIVVAEEDASDGGGRSKSRRAKTVVPLETELFADEAADSESDVAEVETKSQKPIGKLGAIGAVVLLFLASLGYYMSPPQRLAQTANRNVGAPVRQPQRATPKPLRAADLTALKLSGDPVGKLKIPAGHTAMFEIDLANEAEDARSDPRVIHAKVKQIAKLVVFLQQGEQERKDAPTFPTTITVSQLPAPGQSRKLPVQFSVATLKPGKYKLLLELQTPLGAVMDDAEVSFEVVKIKNKKKP